MSAVRVVQGRNMLCSTELGFQLGNAQAQISYALLHMKDDSITELTLGRYTRCKALEKELGKYVELFGAPGLLEM